MQRRRLNFLSARVVLKILVSVVRLRPSTKHQAHCSQSAKPSMLGVFVCGTGMSFVRSVAGLNPHAGETPEDSVSSIEEETPGITIMVSDTPLGRASGAGSAGKNARRLRGQRRTGRFGAKRPEKEIPLHEVAPQLAQNVQFLLRLDPFGHHIEAQRTR